MARAYGFSRLFLRHGRSEYSTKYDKKISMLRTLTVLINFILSTTILPVLWYNGGR